MAQELMTVRRRKLPQLSPIGMGDWTQAVSTMLAQDELSELMTAVRAYLDELIGAIRVRNDIHKGYVEAWKIGDETARAFGSTIKVGFVNVPNWKMLPAIHAMKEASRAVKIFARQVQSLVMMDRVFTRISAVLTSVGASSDANAIDQALRQSRRFVVESDDMFSEIPLYRETKNAILMQAQGEWKMWKVPDDAVDDQRWLAAYFVAADKVVPIPKPPAPRDVRAAGLGALPLLASVLLYALAIMVGGFVIVRTVSQVLPDANSRARTAKELLLRRNEQKEDLRQDLLREGRSDAEVNRAMKAFDDETKRMIQEVPASTDIFSKFALPAAGALLGMGILAKIFKLW